MSDEHFLSRWSRMKRGSEELPSEPAQDRATDGKAEPPGQNVMSHEHPPAPEPAVFDPASLPSLDSIGADTDISGFLRPDVPTSLKNEALRRAWSADPAIRNFVGLQEYDWDFNSGAVAGFGPIGPEHDVKDMVARLFGESPAETNPAAEAPDLSPPEQAVRVAEKSDEQQEATANQPDPDAGQEPRQENLRDVNTAPQQEETQPQNDKPKSRRHGGALPA